MGAEHSAPDSILARNLITGNSERVFKAHVDFDGGFAGLCYWESSGVELHLRPKFVTQQPTYLEQEPQWNPRCHCSKWFGEGAEGYHRVACVQASKSREFGHRLKCDLYNRRGLENGWFQVRVVNDNLIRCRSRVRRA